jgi:hypothetical protein
MSDYNGWTNYATWRVNLEMFDGLDPKDMGWHRLDVYDLSQVLKDYADDALTIDGASGLAIDYARAFMSEVDWRQSAEAMIETYQGENDEQALWYDTSAELAA